ncbi:hypothetical protein B0F90DRAFT_1763275, partial [Multifurca ochricompacta]
MDGDSYYDSENGRDLVTCESGRMDKEQDHRQIHHQRVTIHVLPDDVLVEIFDFYVLDSSCYFNMWSRLLHVCRRWRHVMFSSGRRLDLEIFCSPGKRVRRVLDCWPELPLVILPFLNRDYLLKDDEEDDIAAVLEHPSRVSWISFVLTDSLLGKVGNLIQQPFPELESVYLSSRGQALPVLPDNLFGGFAPRLCNLTLVGIP